MTDKELKTKERLPAHCLECHRLYDDCDPNVLTDKKRCTNKV